VSTDSIKHDVQMPILLDDPAAEPNDFVEVIESPVDGERLEVAALATHAGDVIESFIAGGTGSCEGGVKFPQQEFQSRQVRGLCPRLRSRLHLLGLLFHF